MASGEDPNAVIGLATEAVAPVEQELRRRLTVPVNDRDALAIEAALLKAYVKGLATASSEAAELQIEQAGQVTTLWGEQPVSPPQPPQELPRLDPWAEKYGANS
jgi:hypothetical protein